MTVGVVTNPFSTEGGNRKKYAKQGLIELRKNVDTLLIINNDKLIQVYGDLTLSQAFARANEVLNTATKGIAEVISQHLLVNIDLNDARRVLQNSGTAVMGQAESSGENRAIEAAQVIEELIEMAKKFREDLERGIALGLSSAERSFYDALAENPSAQKLMEEKVLANMAKELAEIIRRDANIDWQYKENVRAKLRLKIKTLLKRYKYPPDEQITAVETVLQQAETLGEELVAS